MSADVPNSRSEGSSAVARTLLNRRAAASAGEVPPIETGRQAAAIEGPAAVDSSPKLRRGKSRRNLLQPAAAPQDAGAVGNRDRQIADLPVAAATAAFPASYDSRPDQDDETARLLYDPENPEALHAILQRLKIGDGDRRVIFEPEVDMPPAWVHRWNELRLYSNAQQAFSVSPLGAVDPRRAGTVLECLEGCRLRLQIDLREAQQLRSEIQIGIDGGVFGVGCRQVETPDRHPGDPFWTEVGAAERYVDDLLRDIQASLQLCEEALQRHQAEHPTSSIAHPHPFTVAPRLLGADGFATDGSQHRLLCGAAVEAQHAVARRIAMECVTDTNHQWGRRTGGAGPKIVCDRTDTGITRLFTDVPVIHDHFVIDKEVSRTMDPFAIREPDMLSSPQTIADAHNTPLYRSYTIHVPFLRFRDDMNFTREQQYASQLLDAYEQYQLLAANLKPELKSRAFYRQLLSTLEVQQQVHLLSMSTGGPSSSSTTGAFSVHHESASGLHARETYLAQQQQQCAVLRELYQRSVEAERSCLYQMVNSWRQLCAVRDTQGFRSVRLTLAMRRHGGPSGGPDDASIPANDILHYVPVLTDAELPPMPFGGASPQQRAVVSPTENVLSAPTFPPVPQTQDQQQTQQAAVQQQQHPKDPAKERKFFISVYARTSTALPPKIVGSTAPRPLNTTATAHINETFELRTQHDPTELILQIVRDSDKQVLSSVRIPASTSQAALLLPFTTGAYFTDPDTGEAKQECGLVSVATTWTTSEGQSIDAIERMFLRGEADPLDPRNEKFVQLLRKYYMETSSSSAANALDGADGKQGYRQGTGGLYLPLPAALGARHELLRRRWLISSREDCAVDEIEAKLVDQAVPLEDNQVKRLYRELKKQVDATKAIAASQSAAVTGQSIASTGVAPAVPSAMSAEELRNQQRHQLWQQGIKNVKLMHRSRRRLADHEKLAKHLVLPPLPTFRGVFQYLIDSLSPQSNFNPRRENRMNAVDIDRSKLLDKGGVSTAHIVVHVMKAANLPMRDDGSELEPQVEASFVSCSVCGRTEAGCNPSWFESLKVRFEPPDFEEDTLSLIDDMIILSVYDRLRITLPPAAATLGATPEIVHYRVERRLIGTVKIPFYTLYTAKKASLEGLYTLVTPRWIMGYHIPREAPSTLQLYVALNPPLCGERTPTPRLASELSVLPVAPELHQVHWIAFQWRERVTEILQQVLFENPNAVWRNVDPFVPNAVGDPTLICRYILARGGPPPQSVTTVPAAIRFVALQHFEVDMVTWGDRDVWSTNAEFLAKGKGDYEELALLLVHLLRYLAPQSSTYLLMGKGNHYHQAAFVLHVINGDWKIIDPRTGNISDAHDPHCELAEVSMVISHDQVYGNIQLSGTPYRMIWDVNDQRYWAPMFPPNLPPELQLAMQEPLQREHLVFKPPLEHQAMIIEDTLKKSVKKALKTWRNDRQPPFQERVGTILREVLEELERERRECANYQQNAVDEVHRKALSEFEGEYVAIGNPVCAPYRPDDSFTNILDAVFETAVHRVGTDSVRYGLATYAFPFTETTVVMWVYLVALVPRRLER